MQISIKNMCVIVNLDLVVPAAITLELTNIKSLNGYRNNKDLYLSSMTISADQIMNYAMRMRAWDLGRVIVNFDREDAVRYLNSNADMFKQIHHDSIYVIKVPQTDENDMEESVAQLIKKLTSTINYPPRVLRTVGLLM